MVMSPSVKRYYISSTLILGAILMFLTSCGGAYVSRDQMIAGSMFKTYVKVCRPDQMSDPIPGIIRPGAREGNELPKPEMARWTRISGSTATDEIVTVGPVISDGYCVEIGNNSPPQGFWGNFFEFLAAAAPIVGLAFGIPAL
jgi:hypothetical protein